MCGRFAYNKEQITPWAKEKLGVILDAETNLNVSPSQSVVALDRNLTPINLTWGIKPSWAKKLLINAQAETASAKPTFKKAFAENRCLIPCSGWYEWKGEGGPRKQKYYFFSTNGEPFLMAGIWFEGEESQLVTLTTVPNEKCAEIHKRMPVIIPLDSIKSWFDKTAPDYIMSAISGDAILIRNSF